MQKHIFNKFINWKQHFSIEIQFNKDKANIALVILKSKGNIVVILNASRAIY